MSLMQRIRVYHATLAILAVLAYLTGDFGLVHSWIGYGVAVVVVLRLMWAVANPRQLGLNRVYPRFDGLRFDNAIRHPAVSRVLVLAVAVMLVGATVTGIAMDRGRDIGFAEVSPIAPALADDDGERRGGSGGFGDDALEELHESLSDLMILFVVLHAGYLILFKRPLARFMLFRDRAPR